MAIDLQTEIVNLRRSLLAMGAATERRLALTARALVHGDVAAAQEVKATDSEIDAMEVELETQCMRILALGSPVAHDLRFVLSVVRISSDFERIADLSRGISKKVIRWGAGIGPAEVSGALADMASAAQSMLADVLAALSDRERQVLELRFGLLDGKDHTLEEVSRYFNVTRERIRQIEAKALRKLRHPSRSERLRSFLDTES